MRVALGLSASFLLTFVTAPALAADPSVSAGDVTVRYDSAGRSLTVLHREAGAILDRIAVKAKVGGREVSSDDAALTPSITADGARGELVLALSGALTVKATVRNGEVEFRAEGNIVALGPPGDVLSSTNLRAAFGVSASIAWTDARLVRAAFS